MTHFETWAERERRYGHISLAEFDLLYADTIDTADAFYDAGGVDPYSMNNVVKSIDKAQKEIALAHAVKILPNKLVESIRASQVENNDRFVGIDEDVTAHSSKLCRHR